MPDNRKAAPGGGASGDKEAAPAGGGKGNSMNNEEKIIALLEKHGEALEKINTRLDTMDSRLDTMDARLDTMDARLNQVEHDTTWIRLEIENQIEPNQKVIFEHQSLLIETTAKKEDVEALREELGIQKFKLQAVTERLHTDAG